MSLAPSTSEQIHEGIEAVRSRDDDPGDVVVRVAKERRKIAPINPFALCFAGSMFQIMDKHTLSATSLKLLFLLIQLSKHGNLVSVNQKGLAAQMRTSETAVSRSMKSLIAAGIILDLPTGRFFNPQLITQQGLAEVARSYPHEVSAGIAALASQGMGANWNPTQD